MATAPPAGAKRSDDEIVAIIECSSLVSYDTFDRRVVDVVVSHKFNPPVHVRRNAACTPRIGSTFRTGLSDGADPLRGGNPVQRILNLFSHSH